MKRLSLALGVVLIAAAARGAEDCSKAGTAQEALPTCTAIFEATGAEPAAGATSVSVQRKKPGMSVQAWDANAAVNQVVIECRSRSTAPWYPCYTLAANIDATGKFATLPAAAMYRARLTGCVGCKVSVNFEQDGP